MLLAHGSPVDNMYEEHSRLEDEISRSVNARREIMWWFVCCMWSKALWGSRLVV